MLKLIRHSLCAAFIAVALGVLVGPGTVGFSQSAAPQDKKQAKQEREYQKIKQFSEKLYAEDALFREEVDESYRQKRREHSELAYFTNTRDNQDDQVMRTGDKLKVNDTLYDNPLVQDYVNRVGQSIVPKDSKKLYAFKVTLNPIPEARALSTGTIYISSGLLSIIDNEAQLAYVLGHEVGHVEKDHWREDVVVERGIQRYYEKQAQKRALIGGLLAAGAGAIVGGATNSFGKGVTTGLLVAVGVPTVLKLLAPDAVVSWDKQQEDEADQLGLKYMFDRNYDPREAPKFYASLQRLSQADSRASLGFMAETERVLDRLQQVNSSISGFGNLASKNLSAGALNLGANREPDKGKALNMGAGAGRTVIQAIASGAIAPEIKAKIEAGELIGSSAEFATVMAELRRDNGLRAFYYDMFQMARDNLEESLLIRSNDPFTHFYYGKVLKLTARNSGEKQHALSEFVRAIELDKRRVVAEPHLYRALALIETRDAAQSREIVSSLQDYVTVYQREHSGSLPPNMDVIYDYMQEVGEMEWAARPALNVSTKNIDPIGVQGGLATSAPSQASVPVTVTPASTTPAPVQQTTPKSRKP
ncbi:MAG TPA: M48 family metallopeptidase [Blastocatellia bacterium]|nr:M48 family metallopeptidase [Blastocatellia bacterium]